MLWIVSPITAEYIHGAKTRKFPSLIAVTPMQVFDSPRDLCLRIGSAIFDGSADHLTVGHIRSLLRAIADDPMLRGRMFKHPLGFVDFPASQIYELPWKARLHIWRDASSGGAYSNIHCHNSVISSFVASGKLVDLQYEVTDGPPTHASYRVEYEQHASRRIRTGALSCLVLHSENTVAAGSFYLVPAFRFHQTVPSATNWPVTFMISYNEENRPAVAMANLDGPEVLEYDHADMTDCDAQELLDAAIKALGCPDMSS